MNPPSSVKKSESLEIRLSYAAKLAFMARCRQRGQSASEALRGYIESELTPAPPRRAARHRRPAWRLALGALGALIVAACALPSLAHPAADHAFSRFDDNGDGAISRIEFARHYSVSPFAKP